MVDRARETRSQVLPNSHRIRISVKSVEAVLLERGTQNKDRQSIGLRWPRHRIEQPQAQRAENSVTTRPNSPEDIGIKTHYGV